jgi:hypothetical protein
MLCMITRQAAADLQTNAMQVAAQEIASQARASRASAQEYLDKCKTEVDVTEGTAELIKRLAIEHSKAADTISGFFKRQTNEGKKEMSELERDIADGNIDKLTTEVTKILNERRERIIEASVQLLLKIGENERPPRYSTRKKIVDGKLIDEKVRDKSHEERELEKYCAAYSKVTAYLKAITANKAPEDTAHKLADPQR